MRQLITKTPPPKELLTRSSISSNDDFMQIETMQLGSDTLADGEDASAFYTTPNSTGTVLSNQQQTINGEIQSIKITADAGATFNVDIVPYTNPTDMTSFDDIVFMTYIEDNTASGNLVFYVSNNDYAQFSNTTAIAITTLKNGWNNIHFTKSDFTGTALWTIVDKFRFRVVSTGAILPVSCGGIFAAVKYTGEVLITFDDVFKNVVTYGVPILKANNQQGTLYVTSGLVGNTGYVTEDDLIAAYDAGWAVCNHFNIHTVNLNDIPVSQLINGLNACRDYLNSLGLTKGSNHVAYVGGHGSTLPTAQTEQILIDNGYQTATTDTQAGLFYKNVYRNKYEYTRVLLAKGVSYAAIEAKVDSVIADGGTLMLYGHDIDPTDESLLVNTETNSNQWGIGKVRALSNYIATNRLAGNINNSISIPDWFNK